MTALLKIFFTLLFGGVLFWVTIVNRSLVSLSLAPLIDGLSLPLGAIIVVATIAGFLWGALIVWLNGAPVRTLCREQKKELRKLSEKEGGAA